MHAKKPLPTDPGYAEYVAAKHKRLLAYAKAHCKDDPESDDCKTFDREVANFFAADGRKARVCPHGSGRGFRLAINTKMFGGQAKHVSTSEWRRAVKEIRNQPA